MKEGIDVKDCVRDVPFGHKASLSGWMNGFVKLMSCSLLATIVERILRSVLDSVMGRRFVMMV